MDITDETKDAPLEQLVREAEAGTAKEHRMGIIQALRTYPKARDVVDGPLRHCHHGRCVPPPSPLTVGYDVVLAGNFFAYPAFTKRVGFLAWDGRYQISAPWQAVAGLGNGAKPKLGRYHQPPAQRCHSRAYWVPVHHDWRRACRRFSNIASRNSVKPSVRNDARW